MQKIWTKDEITKNIQTSKVWLQHGILAIWKRQTEDEKDSGYTRETNGVGFNKLDSKFMSSVAEFLNKTGFLTPKQEAAARKKMIKYTGQLTRIANKKI